MVEVTEVVSSGDREAFLALPDRLYAGDPAYVPPLRAWLRRRLAPSNPLFDKARLKLFLARREAEVVGRISVLLDAGHNEDRDEQVAWFGFCDFVDDGEVAGALLDRATAQAADWGADVLRGQRNLTRWEDPGITVEGFDTLPPMLCAHHPPYVARRLEEAGLVKHHDLLAYDVPLFLEDGSPRPTPDKLREKAGAVDLPGLEVRRVRWRHLRRDLRTIHTVLNEAYRTVPDTAPMPWPQFLGLAIPFLAVVDKNLVQIATVEGRPAGFVVCVPEINEALVHGPWGALPALRRVRTAAFKLIGVLEEHRGSGLHARLVTEVIEGCRRAGYARIDASVIDERNKPMRGVVEGAGMEVYRRFRFYERPATPRGAGREPG